MRTDPYTMTLKPGPNAGAAAARAARYIVDRWLPDNRGGIHFLVTPRIAQTILDLFVSAGVAQCEIRVRVTIEGNIPLLTVLPIRDRHACAN